MSVHPFHLVGLVASASVVGNPEASAVASSPTSMSRSEPWKIRRRSSHNGKHITRNFARLQNRCVVVGNISLPEHISRIRSIPSIFRSDGWRCNVQFGIPLQSQGCWEDTGLHKNVRLELTGPNQRTALHTRDARGFGHGLGASLIKRRSAAGVVGRTSSIDEMIGYNRYEYLCLWWNQTPVTDRFLSSSVVVENAE